MLSIILPIYNEEDNLPRISTELLPVLRESDEEWEVVVVNDGSTDQSAEILLSLCDEISELRVITHEKNLGLGAAVQTGLKNCRGERIITLDGDFTFHPRLIPRLVQKADETGADCVIGSPFVSGAGLLEVPLHRRFLTRASNGLYRTLFKIPATSITGICRLYRREAVAELSLVSDGFPINAEILAKLIRNGGQIAEVPAPLEGRTLGESKAGLVRETCRHLKLVSTLLRQGGGLTTFFCGLILAGATFLLFSPALQFEFLNWDDQLLLTDNPWYLPLTLRSIAEMWNPLSLWRGVSLEYAPVRDMTYVFDRIVWGWSSFGFHFTQLVLHALNACLAFLLLHRFVGKSVACAAAALWVWHPLTVEPVAWISSRKDLLLASFYFLVLLTFLEKRYRWAGLFGTAAILSKYAGGTVGAAAWVIAHPSDRRGHKIAGGLTIFGLSVIVFAIAANIGHETVVQVKQAAWPAGFQVFTHVGETFFYPLHLNARYVHHPEYGWTDGSVALGFLLFLIYVGGVIFAWRRRSTFLFPLLFFGITLLPHLPIVPTNNWLADRYLYLPSFGLVWLLAQSADRIETRRKGWGTGLLILFAVTGAFFTHARLPVWRDSLALWQDTAQKSPSLYYVWNNLGLAQMDAGDLDAATASFQKSKQLNPEWKLASLYLAQAFGRTGKKKEATIAINAFESTASPELLKAHRRERATAWAEIGQQTRAEKLFQQHLKERPTDSTALANLGVLYAVSGREDKALDAWNRAIQFRPLHSAAHFNRARYWFFRKNCAAMREDLAFVRRRSAKEKTEIEFMEELCRRKEKE